MKFEIIKADSNLVWIKYDEAELCYSYGRLIAIRDKWAIYLDERWHNFSRTTIKHRNEFVNLTSKEIDKLIKVWDKTSTGDLVVCDCEEILKEY